MRAGLTLIELIVVLGIAAVLLGLTSASLLVGQRSAVKTGTVEQVVADIRAQQSRAMAGDGSGAAFGVHFNPTSYVLFTGSVYNANDTSNFTVSLNNNINLSTAFPSGNIIFIPVSGEVSGYVNGSDTITIVDATDNSAHVLHVNKYGVADSQT